MSWKKPASAATVLLLALPTLLVMTPGALAQPTLPFAPSVQWVPQVNHEHLLYLDMESGDPAQAPECVNQAGGTPAFQLALQPQPDLTEAGGSRPPCTFVASAQGTLPAAGTTVEYRSVPLTREFNVSGNTSIAFIFEGSLGAGQTMTISVRSGGDQPVTASFTAPAGGGTGTGGATTFTKEINLGATSRLNFGRGEQVVLTLSVASTTPGTWSISDSGSHLRIRSNDALRAATWTVNEAGEVVNIFRPLPRDAPVPASGLPVIKGFFALDSAFGDDDAQTGAPRFTIVRNNEVEKVGPGGQNDIPGEYNDALALEGSSRGVWSFPAGFLDYRGLPAGEYQLHVDMPYHQGGTIKFGILHPFVISVASVRLAAWAGEELSHEVLPAGTTTFLLAVNNTGSANDTFRIDLETAGASAAGWSATVGGPNVTGRTLRLSPGQESLVTVTVNAPFGATGESSFFLVTAKSLSDPTAEGGSVTVTARIGQTVRRELDLIVPRGDVILEPGLPFEYPIYGWNKGTRVANVSVTIAEETATGWSVDLVQGSVVGDRTTLAGIRPGDISEATLRVTGPIDDPTGRNIVTINISSIDVANVATSRAVTFALDPTAAVRVQILDNIGGTGHLLEVGGGGDDGGTGGLPGGGGTGEAGDDGVDGAWFRVWVTNTGRVTETFNLGITTISTCATSPFVPRDPSGEGFNLFFRTPDGGRVPQSQVPDLGPGKTAELYVWRALDRASGAEGCEFRFAVTATGARSGIVHITESRATTTSGADTSAVLLEGIGRAPNYGRTSAIVDITNATKRSLTGGVPAGQNATYLVRLTNGASWATHTDADGDVQRSDAIVRIQGWDATTGWNVSIRPRNGDNDLVRNPWTDRLTLSNSRTDRREAWIDQEIEVRVSAPTGNASALAGERLTFFLQALIAGSSDTSTLPITTIIGQYARVELTADDLQVNAHPGEPAAYLLLVNNTGASGAQVRLRAAIDTDNTTAGGLSWSAAPLGASEFFLPAFKSRTVALLVTPPASAAPGSQGETAVTIDYLANPDDPFTRTNATLRLLTDVVAQDSLTLTTGQAVVTAAPGGLANFTMSLVSTREVGYTITASPIPNWTPTLSPTGGTLSPGVPQAVTLVLRVPTDVANNATFSSVLRVAENGDDANFDSLPLTVSISGGAAIASLSVPTLQKTVDRGREQLFEVNVKNLGNSAGRIVLGARAEDGAWQARVLDVANPDAPSVTLLPNELKTVNVSVLAPLNVPENTVVGVEVTAETAAGSRAVATIQARIHDYGLTMTIVPATLDVVAGTTTEVTLRVRNRGNDNDTLNVSCACAARPTPTEFSPVDYPEWTIRMPVDRVTLEANAERDIKATIVSPTAPLPPTRTYAFRFFAGTLGGAAVDLAKNDTSAAQVSVLDYRQLDVDKDGDPELAIDANKDLADGYEAFREIASGPDGKQTAVVKASRFNGQTRFFLDVPADTLDGIADVWFDPESVYAYDIPREQAFDVTGDSAPDYLLDTDRDAKIDRTYDPETDQYLTTIQVDVRGDGGKQYLVDVRDDARPEKYYDPAGQFVTDTQKVANQPDHIIGLDTDNDRKVDKYYNQQTGAISNAQVANVADFAREYWYFFVLFALLAIVAIAVLARRRHG